MHFYLLISVAHSIYRANKLAKDGNSYFYFGIYGIFTGNCGKVTYNISGSITLKFLNFFNLDYHSWKYITTNFQYHSRSFDIQNASYEKTDIFTLTKHLDCNPSLGREFRKHFKLSPRQFPHSFAFSRVISRFMASGDVIHTEIFQEKT